ncbi:Carbon catabolite repressor protein 4 homolog 4-like protein [Drosera capensis]
MSKIFMAKMSNLAAPLCPRFIPVEQTGMTSISDSDRFKFSMVSYNILAQVYVKSAFFPHSPSACLKREQRYQAVLSLLKSLEADFLRLQYLMSGSPSAIPPVQCEDELPIPLLSGYAHRRGEPAFTNCTPGFTGTLSRLLVASSLSASSSFQRQIPPL